MSAVTCQLPLSSFPALLSIFPFCLEGRSRLALFSFEIKPLSGDEERPPPLLP